MRDAITDRLAGLPAVGTLLQSPELSPLVDRLGRALVVRAARRVLDGARAQIRAGGSPEVELAEVAREAHALARGSLRRVINATGVLLHTNLGRAPLAAEAQSAVRGVMEGYSNLELELASGERGSRHAHASALAAELLDAEDAIAVNNCAGATLLMLAALCRGGEVIVSRGELVEIGGGFRVPDVMRESGATLVEVGTTNRVHLDDYRRAIGERTRAILVVHRSNFAIVGFTAQPSVRELAKLGPPVLVDVGSGLLAEAEGPLSGEPRPRDVLAEGASLVCFSGDKLLGGPQAGIVAGKAALLAPLKKHPLARALRADKLSLAALEATLRLYRDGREGEIPWLAMMREPIERVEARARALAEGIEGATIRADEAVFGGGSLPLAKLPTFAVCVGPTGEGAGRLSAALRRAEPPVITRIIDDRVGLDCRSIHDEELPLVRRAILAARAPNGV